MRPHARTHSLPPSVRMLQGTARPNDSVMTATYVLTIADLFPGVLRVDYFHGTDLA